MLRLCNIILINLYQYLQFRNSWGTGWGMSGFAYLQAGSNVCGIGYYGGYVTPFKVILPNPPTQAPTRPTAAPIPPSALPTKPTVAPSQFTGSVFYCIYSLLILNFSLIIFADVTCSNILERS